MRRQFIRVLVVAAMAASLAVPATAASAQHCGILRGFAHIEIYEAPIGGLLGGGTAFVVFDGTPQLVTFDETGYVATGPTSADVTHVWHFAEGDATFLEHSTPTPIGGSGLFRFRSPVDVSPGGTARYNGIFDSNSQQGWFSVRGDICVGT